MSETPRSLLPQPLDEARELVSHLLPLFTYGTLLGETFVANLLQHEVRSEPALLAGFRLTSLAGFDWPVLVADQDGMVSGMVSGMVRGMVSGMVSGRLYRKLGMEDYRRLDAYEGVGEGLYYRTEVVVQVAEHREPAAVYLPTDRTLRRCRDQGSEPG